MQRALALHSDTGCTYVTIDFTKSGVSIQQPVGEIHGPGNRDPDVRMVQQTLNNIPSAKGGRKGGVLLKVDGICLGKTKAAILQYQTRQFGGGDGRVDPGGRTSRQMSIDSDPEGGPEEELVRHILTLVPAARAVIQAALMKLDQAKPAFEGKSGGLLQSVHQSAQDMVNCHFSLHQFPDWRPEFARIQNLFALMHIASARQTGDSEWTGIFVPNLGSSMEPGAAAYCYPGGYRKHGVETNVLPFAQRTDRIYLCRPLAKDSVQYQTMALVHELSHYVGGDQDTPNMIRDVAYGWVDAPKMKALLPWWRTRNAQSFANFAWDAAFGVKPCGL